MQIYPPKLLIPVGIPGCGKSTFAQVLRHNDLRIVTTDTIRKELTGDESDQTRNNEVFDIYHQRIEEYLTNGLSVYADATNLRDFAREKLRAIVERTGTEAHLFLFTNLKEAVLRNRDRERVVKPDVMVRMMEQYEQALKDIPNEVYTSVSYIEGVS